MLSKHTQVSAWVERELQVKYCEEIDQRRTIILPVVIEDCIIPPLLRPKRFADFRVGYDSGLAQLAMTLDMLGRHRQVWLERSEPKTDTSYCVLPLPSVLAQALQVHKLRQDSQRTAWPVTTGESRGWCSPPAWARRSSRLAC